MDKRILILTVYNPLLPFQNDSDVSYNTGNNVFARAIVSYFYGDGVSVMTRKDAEVKLSEDSDWCRANFDVVVTYEDCLFSACYRQDMHNMATFFRSLGVPVFVLGVGIHTERHSTVRFVDAFAEAIRDFMDAVYSSGGEITVRGEFTKNVCEYIGYSDVFVSGCGSIYYNGANYGISNAKVNLEDFVPILNGYYVNDIAPQIYKSYPRSVFIDQDIYYRAINFPAAVCTNEAKKLSCRQFSILYRTLIEGDVDARERLQTWQFVPQWQDAIERCGASFSYGTRMHGTMVSLLTRVPAFLRVIDARTEELAEFYKIPNSIKIDFDERRDSLYDLYRSLDWEEYNSNYQEILARFGEWLYRKGLPNRIGRNMDLINERRRCNPPDAILLNEKRELARKLFWLRLFSFGRCRKGRWR